MPSVTSCAKGVDLFLLREMATVPPYFRETPKLYIEDYYRIFISALFGDYQKYLFVRYRRYVCHA